MQSTFSDFIIFVDETGDHALQAVDPQYPVFGLAFCILHKTVYHGFVSPALQQLKLDYWGHDNIVLHEHCIRKENAAFAFLRTNPELRNGFMKRLGDIVSESDFKIVSTIIDKAKLKQRYAKPYNPYEIALLFCMERTLMFLCQSQQQGKQIPIIFESRGKKEDNDLELEFRRICDNNSALRNKACDFSQVKFEMSFSQKSLNVPGLQLADLVARPIALNHLRPEQNNTAYEIIRPKLLEVKKFP